MSQVIPTAISESEPALLGRKSDTTAPRGITSHRREIACSSFIVTVPITALTICLLIIVLRYRVIHDHSPLENLSLPSDKGESTALYVDLNSSVILFVTSWASSLAPILTGFILTLVSFPIGRQLSRDIQTGRTHSLPTPYQLALLLGFLDGSAPGAIWGWTWYLFSWRKTRQPQSPALIAASSVAIFATLLGLFVSIADTWLHLTTTTILFSRVSPVTSQPKYSFGLVPRCLETNNSISAGLGVSMPCSIGQGNSNHLANSTISLQVLSNVSSDAAVYTYIDPQGKRYTYLGAPSQISHPSHDFTAHTYGGHTACSLISQQCQLQARASVIGYNCSSAFNGSLFDTNLISAFFTDATMRTTCDRSTPLDSPTEAGNPFYFGLTTIQNAMSEERPRGYTEQEFVQNLHGGLAFILGCNMTIYDIEYDRVNGSVVRFETHRSNTSVSNIWQMSSAYTIDWTWAIKQAIGSAIMSTATGQDFADAVALALSQANLAMGAQGVQAQGAAAVQKRTTSLVARVPIAPLVTLIIFCALFTVVGTALTLLAIWAARDEVPDLKARLGIIGLVADRFEEPGLLREVTSVDGFFEEYAGKTDKRVAIENREDTVVYSYTIWEERPTSSARPESVSSAEGSEASHDPSH